MAETGGPVAGEAGLSREDIAENRAWKWISVAAESQIPSARGVTADLVVLWIRGGLQGSLTRSCIPLCVFREALLKMDATSCKLSGRL